MEYILYHEDMRKECVVYNTGRKAQNSWPTANMRGNERDKERKK